MGATGVGGTTMETGVKKLSITCKLTGERFWGVSHLILTSCMCS